MSEQTTQQATGKPIFTKGLIKFRISPELAQELEALGVPNYNRTAEREQQIIAKHEAEAQARGIDAYRLQRTDQAKHRRPDSGEPVFGPKGASNVTASEIRGDFEALGLEHMDPHIFRKEGDEKFFLVENYSPGERVELPQELMDRLKKIHERAYQFVHVFVNPDGSTTVNCLNPQQIGKKTQVLRVDLDGKYRLDPLPN